MTYIKAIAIQIDPFESRILFEQNYAITDIEKATKDLSKFDTSNCFCNTYEMNIDV